jgi:transporter family protein
MTWFYFAILAGFLFAVSSIVSRFVLREQGNALAYTALHDFLAGLVLVPFIFLFGFHFSINIIIWFFILLYIISAFFADWLRFVTFKHLDVSLYQIVAQTRHIFMLLGGLLVFGELLTVSKIFAVFLIILGVFVALFKKNNFKWSVGIWYAIISSFFAVLAFIFVKLIVVDFSEVATASIGLMSVGLISFLAGRGDWQKVQNEWRINRWGILVAASLFGFFEFTLFMALKLGEVSKVVPVTQSSLVFAVLGGIIFLKERSNLAQKLAGMSVVILGILILNYF